MGCSVSKSIIESNEVEVQNRSDINKKSPSIHSLPKTSKSRKSSSSSSSSSESEKSKSPKTVVTKEMVAEFRTLSRRIQQLEKKKTSSQLKNASTKLLGIDKDLKQLLDQQKELDIKMKKEYADVFNLQEMQNSESISQYFTSNEHFDEQFSKEQKEYIEAKTELENCVNQLQNLQKQQTVVSTEIETLKVDKNQLDTLYDQQDEILNKLFSGDYGSDLEQSLEDEEDEMEKKLEYMLQTMQRWQQAESTTDAANKQLAYACKIWVDMIKITNPSYAMVRMQAMSETRNQLVAAQRNLIGVHRLLHPIKVPYCNADETDTLGKATNYIFIDGLSRDRQHHALNTYQTTYQRSVLLLNWIKTVRTTQITEDFNNIQASSIEISKRLRAERLRLMIEMVKEETGEDMEAEVEDEDEDIEVVTSSTVVEAEKIKDSDGLQERIEEAANKEEEEDADDATKEETGESVAASTNKPKDLEELAPTPSKQQLFGDLDTIMSEYKRQQEILIKERNEARTKQQNDFQERLRKRKSRRIKKQIVENDEST